MFQRVGTGSIMHDSSIRDILSLQTDKILSQSRILVNNSVYQTSKNIQNAINIDIMYVFEIVQVEMSGEGEV